MMASRSGLLLASSLLMVAGGLLLLSGPAVSGTPDPSLTRSLQAVMVGPPSTVRADAALYAGALDEFASVLEQDQGLRFKTVADVERGLTDVGTATDRLKAGSYPQLGAVLAAWFRGGDIVPGTDVDPVRRADMVRRLRIAAASMRAVP